LHGCGAAAAAAAAAAAKENVELTYKAPGESGNCVLAQRHNSLMQPLKQDPIM
jgi:hypothetical protein